MIILKVLSQIGKFMFNRTAAGANFSVLDNLDNILKIAKTVASSESLDEAIDKIKDDKVLGLEFIQKIQNDKNTIAIVDDNKSARQRDQFINNKFGVNFRANLMLFFICLLLIICLVVLIFYRRRLANDVVTILSGITGALSQCLRDAFHFEFGGSRFKRKENFIRKIN